jgi:hypothetical protein
MDPLVLYHPEPASAKEKGCPVGWAGSHMAHSTSNARGKWLAGTILILGIALALVALKFRRLDPPSPTTRPAAPAMPAR